MPIAEADGWLDAVMLLRFREGVLVPCEPTRTIPSRLARLTSAVRPPIIAGLLLIFGIAAALPFRRTETPDPSQPSSDGAGRRDDVSASGGGLSGSRGPASPLRVTSDPQQTAENLLAAFPRTQTAPPDPAAVPQSFRESYAEKAVELVELPRRVDIWNPPRRAASSGTEAELPAPKPRRQVSAADAPALKETVPVQPAMIRQPAAPEAVGQGEDYRWQTLAAPEDPSAAEELPPPTRRQRSLPQPAAAEPVSSTMRLPAVKSVDAGQPANHATPEQPQPQRRYFIREPVFDPAINR